MRVTEFGRLFSIASMTNAGHWFDVSGIGQWSLWQRAALIVVFGIFNLLAVLALWYWLVVRVAAHEHVTYLESRARLTNIESANQDLLAKNLALRPLAFYSAVIAGNKSNKPELGYLLDYMRAQAITTQVRLLHVRPAVTDENGRLPIDVRAQISLAVLADFWSGLILQLDDVELRHLDLQRVADSQKYELAMSIVVETGSYVDEQFWQKPQASGDVKLDAAPESARGKQNRGFILGKDGKSLVYLMGDNRGRLHRVTSD